MHNQIRFDWTLLRDKMEHEIMEQNAQYGRTFIQLVFCKKKFILQENLRE